MLAEIEVALRLAIVRGEDGPGMGQIIETLAQARPTALMKKRDSHQHFVLELFKYETEIREAWMLRRTRVVSLG